MSGHSGGNVRAGHLHDSRRDGGATISPVPFQLLHLWVIRVLILVKVWSGAFLRNESNFKYTKA
jgi:hypothetical protein